MLTPWVFSDEVGALNYALSIMQALYARERTGRGQHVETSQLGATVAFQYYGMAAALFVSCHDIAAIWVAFFSRWQRYRR